MTLLDCVQFEHEMVLSVVCIAPQFYESDGILSCVLPALCGVESLPVPFHKVVSPVFGDD